MANIDTYLQGTDFQRTSTNIYSGVIDLAKLDAAGFASGDVFRLVPFEAGSMFKNFDAEITTALVGVTNTDFGNTIASATDPDDYIDAQTDSAVGTFTTVAAGATAVTLLASDGYIAGSFVTSASITGKIAWSVEITPPAKLAVPRAEPKTYTN